MKDVILDLVNSYEHRVTTVESLIDNAYETTVDSDEGLSLAYETGQRLRAEIRETLVRNCSLRRKDFDAFASKVFSSIDTKKMEIENQRKSTREVFKAYLGRQKLLVLALKQQLAEFSLEGSRKDNLESLLDDIKTSQKEEGEQTLALLRGIQSRLKNFRQELADLNDNLQRILNRGELLRLQDLRQLQSALALKRRKAEKEIRREDVSSLLAHFNRERQEIIH